MHGITSNSQSHMSNSDGLRFFASYIPGVGEYIVMIIISVSKFLKLFLFPVARWCSHGVGIGRQMASLYRFILYFSIQFGLILRFSNGITMQSFPLVIFFLLGCIRYEKEKEGISNGRKTVHCPGWSREPLQSTTKCSFSII